MTRNPELVSIVQIALHFKLKQYETTPLFVFNNRRCGYYF